MAAIAAIALSPGASHGRGAVLASRQPSRRAAQVAVRPRAADPRGVSATASVGRLLGQMIVARFEGTQPSAEFLRRIRLGQIGGVILFADNMSGGLPAIRRLTGELQSAARQGRNPPLLIMTDQEGGDVRRIPGPPTLAPAQMGSDTVAFQQGRAAGALLRSVGVNLDLAPVADVETVSDGFLGTRSFGASPSLVADRACAFAGGLASEGIAFTLKHFPGLGLARTSTDVAPVTIRAPASALRGAYAPYQACAASPMAAVMVSSAVYPALTGPLPAVMSVLTYTRELRLASPRSTPVTISDDLQAGALTRQEAPARTAINAGLDMAMYARTEAGSADAYRILRHDVAAGLIAQGRLAAAVQAVLRLKRAFGAG